MSSCGTGELALVFGVAHGFDFGRARAAATFKESRIRSESLRSPAALSQGRRHVTVEKSEPRAVRRTHVSHRHIRAATSPVSPPLPPAEVVLPVRIDGRCIGPWFGHRRTERSVRERVGPNSLAPTRRIRRSAHALRQGLRLQR